MFNNIQKDSYELTLNAESFIKRILSPKIQPYWWVNLNGEVKQDRSGERYIEDTLCNELLPDIPTYRTARRQLYYFSKSYLSSIDGRVNNIGVEEKYTDLTFKSIIDGAMHRGIVWCLGNPQNLPSSTEAVALCVVRKYAVPMTPQLSDALAPVLATLSRIGIHIVFIDENTGEHWNASTNESHNLLPSWLATKREPKSWDLTPVDFEVVESIVNGNLNISNKIRLFDRQRFYTEYVVKKDIKAAEVSWPNEWQMIEIGLLLRGLGYSAVKVNYCGSKKLQPAGLGVEKRVSEELKNKFGILLNWDIVDI